MRRAGALTATCLDGVSELTCCGTPLAQINAFVLDFAASHGATPATLGYKGYAYACCTSVNHVVCHGFPNDKKLRDGDIVNVDVTLILDGWYGDSSRMYAVGKPKRAAARLVEIAHEAMMRGIRAVRPGARLGDIGHAIQSFAESERCSVVRDFCGHGIGQVFHDSPNILNFATGGVYRTSHGAWSLEMQAVQSEGDIVRAVGILGGETAIHAKIRTAMDAHEVLLKGLPADALLHLVSTVRFLEQDDALTKAIGLSLRTLQRHKAGNGSQRLNVEQSNRTWRFAEIFGHAIDVMGSKPAAEVWMNTPAIGLSNRKPLDLLATSAGVEAVEEYLTRLEYGVYA